MEYFGYVLVWIFGYLIGYNTNKKDPVSIREEVLESLNMELKKDIEYYKDLCKWHVEEKERIKNGT